MIIDGKEIAKQILEKVSQEQEESGRTLIVRAISVAPGAATRSYLGIKRRAAERAGMHLEEICLEESTSNDAVLSAIDAPGADAIIVQLPLPQHLDEKRILNYIPVEKDADVLSETSREPAFMHSPVAEAVREILMRAGVTIEGKTAVVVGEGWLVGAPVAQLLQSLGVQVQSCNEDTFAATDIQEALLVADIVVSGAGSPHLITPAHIKNGAVLIDAGTSEKDAVLVGDIDPACAEKASVFTPVPGGVGPIAVACLFKNASILARKSEG